MFRKSMLFAVLFTLPLLTSCKKDEAAKQEEKAPVVAEKEETPKEEEAAGMNPALLDPSKLTEQAPDNFKVRFETTKGDFVVEVDRESAPLGADRFYNLVKNGFYNDAAFFRVVPGFVVQFGLPADPKVAAAWRTATIQDDPVKGSNTKGTITFATAGPNSRTTQLFINFGDNSRLNNMGFAPFGKVIEGMDVVESINAEYRERPNQGAIQTKGNAYLKEEFPNLDYIKKAEIVE